LNEVGTMKSKSLILMAVAMACGLVAAYTTARLTAKNNTEDFEKVKVASTEIKIGTVLKEPEKLFVEVDYKRGQAPNAVQDFEKMKDKIVTRTVRPGQFIVPDDLSTNFGITPPKGTKAMAIKVTADSAVAGFIMPGARVDVMATIGDNHSGQKPEVQTVLQNQEVLAVDRISVRPDGQTAVETIGTVTLAVTPQNAQKLELAMKMSGGAVRLLLRDQNDTEVRRVNPLKSLTDNTPDLGAGDGAGVRALAAKEDFKPGTVIDDPEKFFHPVSVAALPERGYLDADLSKLKGQTIRVPLFKDSFVTVKHLEEAVKDGKSADATAKAVPVAPPEPVRHVMFIQNGGKEAQMVVYQDGVIVQGSDNSRPAHNPPKQTPPAEEKKAEEPKKAEEKPAETKTEN
jgi:Flp pilus assembly protein CpaB